MVISSETVINKMGEELKKAEVAKNQHEMITHIAHIKLLSELLLDEHQQKEKQVVNKSESGKKPTPSEILSTNNIEDLDGTSIFDF